MVQRKKVTTRRMTRKQRARQLRKRMFLAILLLMAGGFGIYRWVGMHGGNRPVVSQVDQPENGTISQWEGSPPIQVELLTPNSYSRPQDTLEQVRGIVIHYTANPGSTAQQNRDYFEGLKDTQETKASSHFIIGLEGEVIQCIPTSEWSYASNDRNYNTISIECCHPDDSGAFNQATYDSVVELTGWLCKRFGLSSADVIRHYDVTGKLCPKYFVEHEDAWEQLKADIQNYEDSL